MKSYFCQDEYGQIAPVYSISAGLDYPGIGRRTLHCLDTGRADYVLSLTGKQWMHLNILSRKEGIIPAIESAHAIAYARKIAPSMGKEPDYRHQLSGRGDKDVAAIARYKGVEIYE